MSSAGMRMDAHSLSPSAVQPAPTRLRVVIADDHHHVLPEIHLAIRQRLLPFSGVHLVHFDAHPDLGFPPSVDPALVFAADELYDALDESESGIAEFLLPLVFAGHVNRVTWIKPPWAKQMDVAEMKQISIGRHSKTKRLAVSCPWPHFVDDELYAPPHEMEASSQKLWDLEVLELPDRFACAEPTTPWVLDIDLDYFTTGNPFVAQLAPHCDASEVQLLTRVFTLPRYKQVSADMDPSRRVKERRMFHAAMQRLEHEALFAPLQLNSEACRATLDSLRVLYDEPEENAARSHRSSSSSVPELLTSFLTLLASKDDPARSVIWHAAPSLDLPHYEATDSEILQLVDAFTRYVTTRTRAYGRPALVTIATSVSDAFLPPQRLDFVRSLVLEALAQVFDGDTLELRLIEYEPVEGEV